MAATHRGKVLILGSGPAGYTAAIYAARASLKPMLVQGIQPGGQLTITTDVENYPGFADVIQGPWLMEQMQKQAEHVGTQLFFDTVVDVDLSRRPFVCLGDSGDRYEADALIISTGATAKWLGIPTEETFRGGGVSACATCDGFFFRGKEVVVVGGGNTAVEEALYLTHHASKVTLIHRRDSFRAEKILQERLFKNPKVTVLWDHTLQEITGEAKPAPLVKGVRVRNVKTGAEKEFADRRRVHRHRPFAQHRAVQGQARHGQRGLPHHQARFDRHRRRRRLGGGRRAGQDLPPGRNGGRHRLHGGAGGGEMVGGPGSPPRASRGVAYGGKARNGPLARSAKGLREAMSWTGTSCGSSRP